jgi:cystathionine beta-lyase/cystathionine gamma-synthase
MRRKRWRRAGGPLYLERQEVGMEETSKRRSLHLGTRAVHGQGRAPRASGPVVTPIFQSATFAAESLEDQLRLRTADRYYTRYGNPTHTEAETRLAALEGAEKGLVFSSGMAAMASILAATLVKGDHLVAQRELYGGTFTLLAHWLPRWGIETTFVDAANPGAFAAAVRKETRLVLVESPTNPTLKIVDLKRVTGLARERGLLSVIDNTFATPVNQRPHEWGFDLVAHSATKYLSGHSDIICGAVTGSAALLASIAEARRDFGGVMDPHATWLLIRGLKTLGLRVERQNENALRLANFLARHPRVRHVHYPFLESHPQNALARSQMSGGGGVLSFELEGSTDETQRVVESLRLFTLAGSLGGAESLVTLPALTTHATLSPEERRAAGISDRLVRVAVGIEESEDLIADLDEALGHLEATVPLGASPERARRGD